ncbi:PREDICTED: protein STRICTOSIDINE SYNTHASE-LIKE 3 [Brassica oleracea var. oleracea]|uniref:Strictosidine synthase conserved region domain-containing protein n=1 Tax=Brassica oleracea var. oleracea TaxID=109376 RepID=A0A0D3C8I4_BRAOL|nr:PREDICTED: protein STRICTOSIDINE SYNTHASE-LIKE 3 [Brassica oleracea var. oleracea]
MATTVFSKLSKIFFLFAIYCALDPFKHSSISKYPDFQTFKIDMPPLSSLPKERDHENLLQNSEIKFLNEVQGPESIAFDPLGRGPYTGVADGRILFWDGTRWTDFAYTSNNRSELCDTKSSLLAYLKNEHICGRPLGLRFHKRTGDLYVADAYFGIMKVGPEGGLATSLTTEGDGVPLRFTNDLDVDDEGNVYFTDSSSVFQRRNFMHLIVSGEDTGRVLKYNPETKETTTLLRNLQFPNGLSLGKDGSFFIFCEGSIGRLRKYWLKGEKAGTSEVVALLHGFPDNIRTNKDGDFWVAVHCHRNIFTHVMAHHPNVRKFFLKLPITVKFQYLLQVGGWPHAVAVKYSKDGKVLKVLEDKQGKVVKAVSEIEEKDGKLWMGSVLMSFIAVYDLP